MTIRRFLMFRHRPNRLLGPVLVLLAAPLAAQWTPGEMMKIKAVGVPRVAPDGKRSYIP
jgi:hypothetical protein